MKNDIIEATESVCAVAWVDPVLLRESLMAAFETLRLSRARCFGEPYAWDRADLADALAPVLAGEMARRVQ